MQRVCHGTESLHNYSRLRKGGQLANFQSPFDSYLQFTEAKHVITRESRCQATGHFSICIIAEIQCLEIKGHEISFEKQVQVLRNHGFWETRNLLYGTACHIEISCCVAQAPSKERVRSIQSSSLTSFSTGGLGSTEAVKITVNRFPCTQYPQTNAVKFEG